MSRGGNTFRMTRMLGVRGYWRDGRRSFRASAQALTAIVTTAEVKPLAAVDVACEAPSLELLLVEWLNAIIYEMAVRKMVFSRFSVAIRREADRERVDRARHAPACEPKAATYTALKVHPAEDGAWSAACVVDD